MENEKKDAMMEPAVVPSDLQPQPPSKAASVHSAEHLDNDKKYETIQTIKMNEPMSATAQNNNNLKATAMDQKTMSMMNSTLNLIANQEIQRAPPQKGVAANTKLGIIQLVLSVCLSAFGGLLLARNASLSMLGSGMNKNIKYFNLKII